MNISREEISVKFTMLYLGLICVIAIFFLLFTLILDKKHEELLNRLQKQEDIIRILHNESMLYHLDKKRFMESVKK